MAITTCLCNNNEFIPAFNDIFNLSAIYNDLTDLRKYISKKIII